MYWRKHVNYTAEASGSGEVGVAIDITNGAIIGYTGACAGVATELQSPAGSVVVGVWNELSDTVESRKQLGRCIKFSIKFPRVILKFY